MKHDLIERSASAGNVTVPGRWRGMPGLLGEIFALRQ
jgi:hypothetical protein